MLAAYDSKNPPAMQRLVKEGVQLHAYPKDVMLAAEKAAFELYEAEATKNETFRKIYTGWKSFRTTEIQWFKLAEAGYANFLYR